MATRPALARRGGIAGRRGARLLHEASTAARPCLHATGSGRRSGVRCDAGFLTMQLVVAIALSLVLVTSMLNLIAFQYGRGVIRAALDEAVRTGGRATATVADCQARAAAAIDDLLGALGDEVAITCTETPGQMTASATATFRGWLPSVPDWRFELHGASVKERQP